MTKDDIEDVVARWTGVPMTAIKEEEIAKLLRIEEELHKRVISQEKAISRAGARHPPLARGLEDRPSARPVRSCSWARRAWARPKSRARWPSSCSAARSR